MVRAIAALAGVVGEIALLGAAVERQDGVAAQRAKTHRRDIEDRRRIGLVAIRAADEDTKRLLGDRFRRDRMIEPFEAAGIDVVLGAERPLVQGPLGALVDQRALVARERRAVLFAFQKILPDLGADLFEDEADMRRERVIAQDRVALLQNVDRADDGEGNENHQRYIDQQRSKAEEKLKPQRRGDQDDQRVNDKARLQRQQQGVHRKFPPAKAEARAKAPAARAARNLETIVVSLINRGRRRLAAAHTRAPRCIAPVIALNVIACLGSASSPAFRANKNPGAAAPGFLYYATTLQNVRRTDHSWPYFRNTARHWSPTRQLWAASVAPQRRRLFQVMPPSRSQSLAAAGRHGASSARSIAFAAVAERAKKAQNKTQRLELASSSVVPHYLADSHLDNG